MCSSYFHVKALEINVLSNLLPPSLTLPGAPSLCSWRWAILSRQLSNTSSSTTPQPFWVAPRQRRWRKRRRRKWKLGRGIICKWERCSLFFAWMDQAKMNSDGLCFWVVFLPILRRTLINAFFLSLAYSTCPTSVQAKYNLEIAVAPDGTFKLMSVTSSSNVTCH